jgi:hypothetical protein
MHAEAVLVNLRGKDVRGAIGTTALATVFYSFRSSITPGANDRLIYYEQSTYRTMQAVCPARNYPGMVEVVVIPGWSYTRSHFICLPIMKPLSE